MANSVNKVIETISAFNLGIAACSYNFLILFFNGFFTNSNFIAELEPDMFSPFGQLVVLVWGLCFLAAGYDGQSSGAIWLAFSVEKFVYVIGWGLWNTRNDALALVNSRLAGGQSLFACLAPIFHMLYGTWHSEFFFCTKALKCFRRKKWTKRSEGKKYLGKHSDIECILSL